MIVIILFIYLFLDSFNFGTLPGDVQGLILVCARGPLTTVLRCICWTRDPSGRDCMQDKYLSSCNIALVPVLPFSSLH